VIYCISAIYVYCLKLVKWILEACQLCSSIGILCEALIIADYIIPLLSFGYRLMVLWMPGLLTTPIILFLRYLRLLGLVFPWACPWRCSAVDDRRLRRRRLLCCRVHSSYQLNSFIGELELVGFPWVVCFCHRFSLVLVSSTCPSKQCVLLLINCNSFVFAESKERKSYRTLKII